MPKPDVHLRFLGRVGLERTSVNGQANARTKRTAALAVALLAVCLPAAWAIGPPRPQAPRPAPRYERQQARNNREQNRPQPRQGAPARVPVPRVPVSTGSPATARTRSAQPMAAPMGRGKTGATRASRVRTRDTAASGSHTAAVSARQMAAPSQPLQDTFKTGSIGTRTRRFRTRSGCSTAIRASTASPPLNSNARFSSYTS